MDMKNCFTLLEAEFRPCTYREVKSDTSVFKRITATMPEDGELGVLVTTKHKNLFPAQWLTMEQFNDHWNTLDFQDEIFQSGDLKPVAMKFRKIVDALEILKFYKTEIQKLHDYVSFTVIPEIMEDEGIDTTTYVGVGKIICESDMRCNVPAANRDLLKDWLVEHGHGSLVSETVNASSLKALIKEQLKEGNEIPDELVKIHSYTRAKIR